VFINASNAVDDNFYAIYYIILYAIGDRTHVERLSWVYFRISVCYDINITCMCRFFFSAFVTVHCRLIDWAVFLRPLQHSIGYLGDGFYRSKDPTNSIKVLKEKAAPAWNLPTVVCRACVENLPHRRQA